VIALTSFKEEKLVQDALQAGAISYLLKDISAEKLAGAIRAAHHKESTLSPGAAQALIHATTQPASPVMI
jgi:NarL family two-component system response regulator LiaR